MTWFLPCGGEVLFSSQGFAHGVFEVGGNRSTPSQEPLEASARQSHTLPALVGGAERLHVEPCESPLASISGQLGYPGEDPDPALTGSPFGWGSQP